MILSDLLKPNEYGTVPVLVTPMGMIIVDDDKVTLPGPWIVSRSAEVEPVDFIYNAGYLHEVHVKDQVGTIIYKAKIKQLWLVPLTAENFLVHKAIGHL